jgi:hypothetical protein
MARQLGTDNRVIPIGLAGLLMLLAYYLVVWSVAGRGPGKGIIMVRYQPPDGMSPAVMRYIWRMGYDDRCFTAALLSAAAKGHLTLSDGGGEYVLSRKKGSLPLSKDEETVLGRLLPKGGEIRLERASTNLSAAVAALKEHLRTTHERYYFVNNVRYFVIGLALSAAMVVAAGVGNLTDPLDILLFVATALYATVCSPPAIFLIVEVVKRWKSALAPGGIKGVRMATAIALTIAAVIFSISAAKVARVLIDLASAYLVFFLATAVCINYAFYQVLKAPTRAGRTLHDAIEGFREFLMMTEKEKANVLNPPEKTPELFERYLPYALSLDLEQQWSEQFSRVLSAAALGEPGTQIPSWYYSLTSLKLGDLLSPNRKEPAH